MKNVHTYVERKVLFSSSLSLCIGCWLTKFRVFMTPASYLVAFVGPSVCLNVRVKNRMFLLYLLNIYFVV